MGKEPSHNLAIYRERRVVNHDAAVRVFVLREVGTRPKRTYDVSPIKRSDSIDILKHDIIDCLGCIAIIGSLFRLELLNKFVVILE